MTDRDRLQKKANALFEARRPPATPRHKPSNQTLSFSTMPHDRAISITLAQTFRLATLGAIGFLFRGCGYHRSCAARPAHRLRPNQQTGPLTASNGGKHQAIAHGSWHYGKFTPKSRRVDIHRFRFGLSTQNRPKESTLQAVQLCAAQLKDSCPSVFVGELSVTRGFSHAMTDNFSAICFSSTRWVRAA